VRYVEKNCLKSKVMSSLLTSWLRRHRLAPRPAGISSPPKTTEPFLDEDEPHFPPPSSRECCVSVKTHAPHAVQLKHVCTFTHRHTGRLCLMTWANTFHQQPAPATHSLSTRPNEGEREQEIAVYTQTTLRLSW
jgi:hypothetical protein